MVALGELEYVTCDWLARAQRQGTRKLNTAAFSLGKIRGSPGMAQGRISFAGKSYLDYGFAPEPAEWSDFVDLAGSGPSWRSLRDSGDDRQPSFGDERRRATIAGLSVLARERIEEFVETLFDEDSDRCDRMVEAVMRNCGDPQQLVETLFEPAARLVGENWCADECDFIKVTIAVSRMQRIFRLIAAEHPPVARPDLSRCALIAPAPGEQHTFGLSVVDDALRRAGWEVDCCGYEDTGELFRLAAANSYRFIGISVSDGTRLPDLVSIVARLRAKSRNKAVALMAGGSLVINDPQSLIDAGFDMVAYDAASAVVLAESVMASIADSRTMSLAAE